MGCLHQRGSVNPALPWQAARSSCFLLTLLPGCLRWKCTAWLECCFAWHFPLMLSRRVTRCWGEPKGFERVKMHLEPVTDAQRTMAAAQAAGVSTSPEHLSPLPRQSDQNGQLNPLWETGHAEVTGLERDGGRSEHKWELEKPCRVCVCGVCRRSMLCPPGQKEARRTGWTSSTGRRGAPIPSHEGFLCLSRQYQREWMPLTVLSANCNKYCQWLLIGDGLKRERDYCTWAISDLLSGLKLAAPNRNISVTFKRLTHPSWKQRMSLINCQDLLQVVS